MVYSICYDIKDDRRRVQVAKALADSGEGGQFSVFEANLGPNDLAQPIRRASRVLCAPLAHHESRSWGRALPHNMLILLSYSRLWIRPQNPWRLPFFE